MISVHFATIFMNPSCLKPWNWIEINYSDLNWYVWWSYIGVTSGRWQGAKPFSFAGSVVWVSYVSSNILQIIINLLSLLSFLVNVDCNNVYVYM